MSNIGTENQFKPGCRTGLFSELVKFQAELVIRSRDIGLAVLRYFGKNYLCIARLGNKCKHSII